MLYNSRRVITLARKLRVVDYFALGWGTMVGVGWLVVMDDWLLRGGVLGAILGFAIGGALLLPIGYVYGQLVSGHSGRRRRGRLHRQSFSAIGQLCHRLDDDPRIFHRLSVGGGRGWQDRGIHFPRAGFDGNLPHRRPSGLPAAFAHRSGPDGLAHMC